jgi:NitT/TauT family transport system ATP-binding protein
MVLLDRLGLGGFATAYPHEVSGGMLKRAALAQALIHRPALVLLDEPFGALDAFTRAAVEQDLLRLLDQTRSTALFVTHNLQEAIALSDRVIVMSARPGRIIGDHRIELPRPRDVLDIQYTEAFGDHERTIWAQLRDQVVTT